MSAALLALDLGTALGWACGFSCRAMRCGTKRLPQGRGTRVLSFLAFLDHQRRQAGPGLEVAYEQVGSWHAGTAAAHCYGALEGVLLAWCHHHGVQASGMMPQTIRKLVCGHGGSSKEGVRQTMARLGHYGGDHNTADALAVWYAHRPDQLAAAMQGAGLRLL